jgi:hypothetical protein
MTQKWAGFYRGICTVVNPKIGPQGSELFAKFWPRPVVLKRIFHVTIVRKCSPVNYKFFKNYTLGYRVQYRNVFKNHEMDFILYRNEEEKYL